VTPRATRFSAPVARVAVQTGWANDLFGVAIVRKAREDLANGFPKNEIAFLFPEKRLDVTRLSPEQATGAGDGNIAKISDRAALAWYRGHDVSRRAPRDEVGREVAGLDERGDMASVDGHWENGDVLVITITGEVDMSNVDALRERIGTMVPPGTGRVVFDLGELEFMDSSGLSLLVDVANGVGHAALRAPSAIVRRVVDLTGLASLLPTEE
jgi:anti-sigma B factor antagonist